MTVKTVRIKNVLRLERERVNVDPAGVYRRIGIYSWGKGFLHRPPALGFELGSMRYFTFPQGALMLSNIQAWEGAVAVTGEDEDGHVASNRFLPYVPIDGVAIDVAYLAHYFQSDQGLAALRAASPGTQVRNRTLGRALFEATQVPLPSLDDQRRIAGHLDAIAMSQPPGAPSRPQWGNRKHAVHDQIVQQAGGDMTRLSEILSSRAGDPVQPEREYRISGVYSFGRGLLDRGTLRGTETKYASFTELHDDDIVYSKLGAFENAVARVSGRYVGSVVSPEFPVFSLCADVHPEYLIAALTTRNFAGVMSTASAGVGARQRRVSPSVFLEFQVRLPTLQEQQRAVEKLRLLNRAGRLKARGHDLHLALLPAARNELFSSMR